MTCTAGTTRMPQPSSAALSARFDPDCIAAGIFFVKSSGMQAKRLIIRGHNNMRTKADAFGGWL